MGKKNVLLGLSFFIIILLISLTSAIEINLSQSSYEMPDTANIQIMSLKYEPYPVEPGEVFELWIKIENDGKQETKDATCKLILDNPFLLYQGELIQSYGILSPRDQAIFKYKIKVDENAVDGDNILKVECSPNPKTGFWKQTEIAIKVQTRYPTLNILNVKTNPSAITPGHKADLTFTIENTADSSMKDINIKIDFSSVPFAPYQEIGEKKLRRLNAGTNETLTFSIVSLPNAEGGIYKVPIEISYTDDLGTAHSINAIISLEINSKPDLYVFVDSSQLTTSKTIGEITFKVINRGLTDIKFVSLKILPSKQIKLISPDIAYIGDIDSDDSETADFKITVKSSRLNIPIEMTYRDVSNNLYIEQLNISYNLPSTAEAGKGGINWIVIIMIIILIVFAYIKRKPILGWIKSKF
ncbi:MAG: COG1361 S-layer family protein [Candidatus Pacearchaeota archaeon]